MSLEVAEQLLMLRHAALYLWNELLSKVVMQLQPFIEECVQVLLDAVTPVLVAAFFGVLLEALSAHVHAVDKAVEFGDLLFSPVCV